MGQRTVLTGSHSIGSQAVIEADFNNLSFNMSHGSNNGILKFSHTSNMRPLGGDYVLEARSFSGLFNDVGWGVANLTGSNITSNPYQHTTTYTSDSIRNNDEDQIVQFLLRPVRVLDKYHVETFRSKSAPSTQTGGDYFQATAGGKYGLFTYNTPNGRVPQSNTSDNRGIPNTNGPYTPIFHMLSSDDQVPSAMGPNLKGSNFVSSPPSLTDLVVRLLPTQNTLQHHASDAPRNDDFSIKPRFSQSLHPKGDKGDVTYGTSDHTGDTT